MGDVCDSCLTLTDGHQRAEAVAQYPMQQGGAPERLDTSGYGSAQPVASNDTVQGRARNRSVEIIVIR